MYEDSAEAAVYAAVWSDLLRNHLRELGYLAHMASVGNDVDAKSTGLNLHISGFNDSISSFMDKLMEQILSFNPRNYDKQLKNILEQQLLSRRNFFKGAPYLQANVFKNLLLIAGDNYHPSKGLEVLEQFDARRLLDFHDHWMQKTRFNWLIMGNLTTDDAHKIVTRFDSQFQALRPKALALSSEEIPENRVVDIPVNTTWIFEHFLEDKEGFKEANSAIIDYYQYQPDKNYDSILMFVLLNILQEPAFNNLRTDKQLGYIVMRLSVCYMWAFISKTNKFSIALLTT
eukprot:TRINITY_DN1835_c0_g2_i2.p1 TRINITY_DN1835_c0_g2~~TRINITY_DN1835_c0_g2_i2.p1  ORF type:complete len:287 (+),score=82.52 TRINITY_DN1835_c0_g2_i2:753-1613(+)